MVKPTTIFALLGIITGLVLGSIANDEILLIQAQTPAQRQFAEFCTGSAAIASSLISILILTKMIQIRPRWSYFIAGLSSTVSLITITFLTILPQILTWIKI